MRRALSLFLALPFFASACASTPSGDERQDEPAARSAPQAPRAVADAGTESGSSWYDAGGECLPEGCDVTPAHVSVGMQHTCIVTKDGGVRCWGNDEHGQLGGGARTRPIPGLPFMVRVGAGDRHTCALARGGAVWCWGANDMRGYDDAGQLGLPVGDAGATAKHAPAPVPTLARDPARALFVGLEKSCIVVDDAARRVRCWGAFQWGELPASLVDVTFVAPSWRRPAWAVDASGKVHRASGDLPLDLDGVRELSASVTDSALFVLRDGTVRTSSAGSFYPCIPGTFKNHVLPRPGIGAEAVCDPKAPPIATGSPPGLPRAREIAQSITGLLDFPVNDRRNYQQFACAIREDERVACWGQNARGQLGIGSVDPEPQEYYLPPPRVTPIALEGIAHAREVAVGGGHACAITAEHELFCWGVNGQEDRLGTGAVSGAHPRRVVLR